ncbi:uncharacterized protein LAESUDRAFT_761926 [Laetiporus sulphureus 93-53]|uniref:Uncharacterized protein n=1 Tax=Laetiporus sulphureus 93-53 TaxID=1314785 RepID=A0A165CS43_9APHY|nr:uncharacterized protein LAESUDRAFT_761926 [Laetiporus sulphureus 93-53]KZT03342.1 hypothetical protein LAESUDRAFT_761926 [Laetiporus sulphureus 93-53]
MVIPRTRHRSQSPDRRERAYHLGVPPNHLHPSASASGLGVSSLGSSGISPFPGHNAGGNAVGAPGPLPAPGQVPTYEMFNGTLTTSVAPSRASHVNRSEVINIFHILF